jgi:hypothetical protein
VGAWSFGLRVEKGAFLVHPNAVLFRAVQNAAGAWAFLTAPSSPYTPPFTLTGLAHRSRPPSLPPHPPARARAQAGLAPLRRGARALGALTRVLMPTDHSWRVLPPCLGPWVEDGAPGPSQTPGDCPGLGAPVLVLALGQRGILRGGCGAVMKRGGGGASPQPEPGAVPLGMGLSVSLPLRGVPQKQATMEETGDHDRGEGLVSEQPQDSDIDTNWDETIETFDAMDLREDLLRGIYGYGFEKPSAIQQVWAP